eukprot:scaffold20663_cov66-Phaeocystis_antarctica.AAC.4
MLQEHATRGVGEEGGVEAGRSAIERGAVRRLQLEIRRRGQPTATRRTEACIDCRLPVGARVRALALSHVVRPERDRGRSERHVVGWSLEHGKRKHRNVERIDRPVADLIAATAHAKWGRIRHVEEARQSPIVQVLCVRRPERGLVERNSATSVPSLPCTRSSDDDALPRAKSSKHSGIGGGEAGGGVEGGGEAGGGEAGGGAAGGGEAGGGAAGGGASGGGEGLGGGGEGDGGEGLGGGDDGDGGGGLGG